MVVFRLALLAAVAGCAAPGRLQEDSGAGGGDGGADGSLLIRDGSVQDQAGPPDLKPACLDAGTICNTGHPGQCAMGKASCNGDSPICVPDQTAQVCYGGPAGTVNVGICKAGTQSCIGTLGPCNGEVLPAAIENCFNDLDDDCDGVVNNGCPIAVSTGTPRALASQGGAGGGPASARCPAGRFVTRASFYFNGFDETAMGLQLYCSTPTLVRGASAYSITVGAAAVGPSMIGSGDNTFTGSVDCGTTGLVSGWRVDGRASNFVYGMGLYCANGTLSLSASNQLSVSFAYNSAGNAWNYPYGTAYSVQCNANEVLIGYDGRIGAWMDQLTPICAPLTFTYK